jgi:hypothetical protein
MNRLYPVAALFGLLFASLPALATPLPGPDPIARAQPVDGQPRAALPVAALHLKGGRWFDGERFVKMEWFVVDGELTAARPDRAMVAIDLDGRWIVPPLAEAHNHDLQNAWFAANNAPRYIERGIFYSGQFCADPDSFGAFHSLMNRSGTPDVVYAAACISASDGHPLGIALASWKAAGEEVDPDKVRDHGYWAVDTLADLDARWDRIAASKPAIVKVILIDAANHAANRRDPALFGYNGLDPALLPELARRTRALDARLAAHVDTARDFEIAIAGGAEIIAHLPGYRIAKGKTAADYRLSDAAIAQAASAGVTVVTTMAASRYHIRARPDDADAIRGNYADNLKRLLAAGVKVAFGSDAIDGSVLDEIREIDSLGLMPRERLLSIATRDTARFLFPKRAIGAFAEGHEASLIVLDGDPVADLAHLGKPAMTIKQGVVAVRR